MQLNEKQQALADDLRAMLKRTHTSETMLVVGYAGTGKTATLAHVLSERDDVLYLTPSHKAKNVLREALPGADVQTLHRALGWRQRWSGTSAYYAPSGDRDERLRASIGDGKRVIVLDECSMIGGAMFEHLLHVLGLDTPEREGAYTLIERTYIANMGDPAHASEDLHMLFNLRICPQDGSTVFGRPRSNRSDAYTYHVEGARQPVKLIVMGDPAQLPPVVGSVPCDSPLARLSPEIAWLTRTGNARVGRNGFIESTLVYSPTFTHIYDHRHNLTQLMRTSHQDLSHHNLEARRAAMRGYDHRVREWSEHIDVLGRDEFVGAIIEAYRRQEDAVVLAFRNTTCDALNKRVRAELLGAQRNNHVLHVGEPCDLHSPLRSPLGDTLLASEMDNGDLVYITHIEPHTTHPFESLPSHDMTPVHCYRVTVRRARDGQVGLGLWLTRDQAREARQMREAIDAELETLDQPSTKKRKDEETIKRVARINELEQRGRALRTAFTDIRPAYVKTIHKSQGGTWDRVFFAQYDLCTDMAPRLAYVAISRARHHLTVC